ncbi:MAG: accessory gene regulator B family protein [Lachnospiraceae bacterium]|nr:accessory gene regulator B family protein [Lachnospiraceae bacterium]
MLNRVTEHIVTYLVQQGVIESEQREIYFYGFHRGFVDGINIISLILISLFFGQLLEAVVFIIAFRLLRSYAGGYHAKTQWHCYFLTMFTIVTALSIIKYINVSMIVSVALWMLSGVIIFLWSPVEAENKPLDEIEIRIYGKKAKLIFLMETICFLVSLACNWISMYESILLAVICTSMSLVVANVKKLKS